MQDIEAWKRNIKDDVFTNYCHAMAIATWNLHGAAIALRWIEEVRLSSANADVTAWLCRSVLNELGRMEEAQTIHGAALAADPHYEVSALRRVAKIQAVTSAIPDTATVKRFGQAITIARDHGDAETVLFLALQQTTYCLRQNQPVTMASDILAEIVHLAGPAVRLAENTRQDIVQAAIELATAAALAVMPDLGGVAIRLLVASAAPEEIDAGHLSTFARLLLPARGHRYEGWPELQQNLMLLLERMTSTGINTGEALTSLVRQAFGFGAFELGELGAGRALAIDPTNVPLRLQVAKERWVRGAHEGALAILEMSPPQLIIRAHLAMYLSLSGRTDEALTMARATLTEAPEDHLVQNRAGSVLVAAGCSAELVERLAPLNVCGDGPVITLALALQALGRYSEALALIDRLAEPAAALTLAIVRTVKAVILEDMGRAEEAKDLYRLAAKTENAAELLFQCQIRPTIAARMIAGLRRAGMVFAKPSPT